MVMDNLMIFGMTMMGIGALGVIIISLYLRSKILCQK
jgi:hypothetical protein